MVLKYRGAPPFKVPIQTITGEGYAKPGASENTLKQKRPFMYVLDTDNIDSVREIMNKSGLTENDDWWIVKWEDEGLPDPETWSLNVVKIKVPAGGSVSIIVPTVPFTCTVFVKVYGSSNVSIDINTTGEGNLTFRTPPVILQGQWAVLSTSASWHPRFFPRNFSINITNNGSSDEYVYIAEINVISLINDDVMTEIPLANMRYGLVEGSNTTITIESSIGVTGNVLVQVAAVFKGDGTNAVTASILVDKLGTHEIGSVTVTSSDYYAFVKGFIIKSKGVSDNPQTGYRIRIVLSSTGYIGIKEYFVLIQGYGFKDMRSKPKRTSGRYTSDGNGQTDTVTLLDYTTGTKHIGRLLRVKATGDANTTQLQLQVDGEVVWDFLSDGDTCTLDIRDVNKVELLVNDNGSATATSTTTVNYVVQYEEEDSVICR